ncbi:hypothetical protein ACFLTN_07820 [Chloroflexota bacterium]
MKSTDVAKTILKYLVFAAVPLALVIVSACTPWQAAEKGGTMALKGTIPPIDVAVPAQTETATFSLG